MTRDPVTSFVDPWHERLGLTWIETRPDRMEARVEIDSRHHQALGIVHGGVYCSIVEGVASYGAALAAAERGDAVFVGVANATDFIRSHREGPLRAIGTPEHLGRTFHLWKVDVFDDSSGKLVASGRVRLQALGPPATPRRAEEDGKEKT